ncbi:MAG: cytochrome c peroxidase [Planctomycetota bacterium]
MPPPAPDPSNAFADSEAAARLGRALFFDPGLSGDGRFSCATCHDPGHGFSDPRPLADGAGPGTRHAPTLIDAAAHHWFGWGGKADSQWSQALGPLEARAEMAGDRVAIVRHIAGDPALRSAFEDMFGVLPDTETWPTHARPLVAAELQEHTVPAAWTDAWDAMDPKARAAADRMFAAVGKALAAYQRRLRSGPAPFDNHVAALRAGHDPGDRFLSPAARAGFDLFRGKAGCVVCHTGPHFSDGEVHNTGAPPADGSEPTDPGRFQGGRLVQLDPFHSGGEHSDEPEGARAERTRRLKTGSEQWGEFKTPSLRNLVVRGPYMHTGVFPDLPAVIAFYDTRLGAVGASHHQEQILRPLGLTDQERAELLAFLESLQGAPPPAEWTRPPDPESSR